MPTNSTLLAARRAEYRQRRAVERLRADLYGGEGHPSPERMAELQAAERELRSLAAKRRAAEQRGGSGVLLASDGAGADRTVMGAETTGIDAKVLLRMSHVPTGIVHLLSATESPLVTFELKYTGSDFVRLRLTSYVENYSAQAVTSVELLADPPERASVTIHHLPTFFRARLEEVNELTRATLHVQIENLDGEIEQHNSYPIWLLARTSAYNYVEDPATGKLVDLGRYLGAWVTPNAPEVMNILRRAAELHPEGKIVGYQVDAGGVRQQVEAIFAALKAEEIRYVNSVLTNGAAPGSYNQRVRLPREALATRSANCIDGTVLMSSLLEAASLNPGIVLVPGHAFVAWEKSDRVDDEAIEWDYLETTMIGSEDFDAALKAGRITAAACMEQFKLSQDPMDFQVLPLLDLRLKHGITPME